MSQLNDSNKENFLSVKDYISAIKDAKKIKAVTMDIKTPLIENTFLIEYAEKWTQEKNICISNSYLNERENRRLEENNIHHKWKEYFTPTSMTDPLTAEENFAKGYYNFNKDFPSIEYFDKALIMGLNKGIVYIYNGIANIKDGDVSKGDDYLKKGLSMDPGLAETADIIKKQAYSKLESKLEKIVRNFKESFQFNLNNNEKEIIKEKAERMMILLPLKGEAYYYRSLSYKSKENELKDLLKSKELGFINNKLDKKINNLRKKLKIPL